MMEIIQAITVKPPGFGECIYVLLRMRPGDNDYSQITMKFTFVFLHEKAKHLLDQNILALFY